MPRLLDNPEEAFVDARYRDVLAFGQRVLGRGFHVHERHPGLIEGLRELSAFRRSNRAW